MTSRLLTVVFAAIFLAGCDSPENTAHRARRDLAAYKANPTEATDAVLQATLSKLDSQVAELERKGDSAQADLFRQQAENIRTDLQAFKMARALQDARRAVEQIGEAFKEAGRAFSDSLRPTNGSPAGP
ncbi:MAG: hypothetical protein SFU53_10310 [Terrimicrobiaceae bacterium]|nr:hypothetical protein [Terrimicrobiaceae bacterium]